MLRRGRSLAASVFVLILVGSIGFFSLTQRPRFQAFHAVDVVQLLATGMCYGVALAGIVAMLRKPRTD